MLSPDAWEDMRVALSESLASLLLIQSDVIHVQRVITFWIEAQAEMLHRLRLDRADIEKHLADGRSCEKLKAIRLDLSDRHAGGRSVAVLTFDSGFNLVYKPRETDIEQWYFQTLARLNHLGAPLPFAIFKILSRPMYGWMQFVSHQPCKSEKELSRYYRNAGALLCVLHVLAAADCHFQNLVACLEYPVLIDAETLFQPILADCESTSIMRTGMVPQWRFGPQGEAYDVSALGCVAPRSTHLLVPTWNGDEIGFKTGVLMPHENVPFLQLGPFTPQAYVDEIICGFTEIYRFLADHRGDLMTEIHKAQRLTIRYVFRETVEYYEAMSERVCSKATHEMMLRTLSGTHAVFDPLQQDEVRALEQLDIPRFTLIPNSRDLGRVRGCFGHSGLTVSVNILNRLCEEDLDRQLAFLRLAWGLVRVSDALP